mmetsp:Transcript_15531/g.21002  ORF Transcript_15531/g.21002 Transcript_15531/m.21002 type:complete len:356 (-) Transcript_15531:405-1472(-)
MEDGRRQHISAHGQGGGRGALRLQHHNRRLTCRDVAEEALGHGVVARQRAAQALQGLLRVRDTALVPVKIVVLREVGVNPEHPLVRDEGEVAGAGQAVVGVESVDGVAHRLRGIELVNDRVRSVQGAEEGGGGIRLRVAEVGDPELQMGRGFAELRDSSLDGGHVRIGEARIRDVLELVGSPGQDELVLVAVPLVAGLKRDPRHDRLVRVGRHRRVGLQLVREDLVGLGLLVEEGGHVLDVLGLVQVARVHRDEEVDGVGLVCRAAGSGAVHEDAVGRVLLHALQGRVAVLLQRGIAGRARLLPAWRHGVGAHRHHALLQAQRVDEAEHRRAGDYRLLQGDGEVLARVVGRQRFH